MNLFSPEAPVLLVGPPGVGKTATVKAQFDHVEVCLASTLVEEDIAGLPYREGTYDYRTVPAMFRRLAEAQDEGRSTALFLDELDKARRSVADTLLTLVASRRVGDAHLPARTCIVAAANPPEFGGGDGISDAMVSRFAVVDYVADPERWARWADEKFTSDASRRVIEAVRSGELPILDMAGEGLERRITAPRTLEMALRTIERGSDVSVVDRLVRGMLTAATASHLMHFVRGASSDVMKIATSTARQAAAKGKTTDPLRL